MLKRIKPGGLTFPRAAGHCETITAMSNRDLILQALSEGDGAVRLAPCWVPRSFLMPGGRLKLDPRDLYTLGAHRGASTNAGSPPPPRPPTARLPPPTKASATSSSGGRKVLLRKPSKPRATSSWAPTSCGEGGWNLLCKFFDNLGPIPTTCIRTTSSPPGSARRASPKRTISRPIQLQGQQLPLHLHGPGARHHGEDIAAPGTLERGRQRHPLSLEGVPAATGHGWQIDPGILTRRGRW